jgi:hypothetical protein
MVEAIMYAGRHPEPMSGMSKMTVIVPARAAVRNTPDPVVDLTPRQVGASAVWSET